MKSVSVEEVAQHNTVTDGWVVIGGVVYDVTKFIKDHPGGSESIEYHLGKDATKGFEEIGHSQWARTQLKTWEIAKLEPKASSSPRTASPPSPSKTKCIVS